MSDPNVNVLSRPIKNDAKLVEQVATEDALHPRIGRYDFDAGETVIVNLQIHEIEVYRLRLTV
jgi:hypothetical protein